MAKKKNTIPSGFDDILSSVYDNAEQTSEITNIDAIENSSDIPVEDEDTESSPVDTEDGNKEDDITNSSAKEDDSEIPEDVINNNKTNPDQEQTVDDTDEDITDADVAEAQQVGLLFDAIGQSLGWNMSDIDEKDRPLTVDDLANYFVETVNQNSVPQYADERIRRLDEYVKNGGKFEDFYQRQSEQMSLDNLDMEDESNQKAIIRELLKYNNYSDEQINKKLQRYEDADVLYEESEDALDRLKHIRAYELEQQTKQQEAYAKQQDEMAKRFFDQVSTTINQLTDIRGIAIPKEDRSALFDYIFKVDQNGMSQYQKDFNQNLSKNLIESAYFTMKADTLISNARRDGESSATEKLRKIMRHTAKNHTSYNADEKQKSVTDLLAGVY